MNRKPAVQNREHVRFMLSKQSPLRPNQKQQLKADIRHGNVQIKQQTPWQK